MPRSRSAHATGASRSTLALAGAIIAAVMVLAMGASRSGPDPSGSPPALTSGLASLPALTPRASPTDGPTEQASATPPEVTQAPSLRGQYVGGLAFSDPCLLLAVRGESYELILPDGYRLRQRQGRAVIVEPGGSIVAGEGDLVGINGQVRTGGSTCIVGPQLHVTRIVEVVPREPG